MHWDTHRFALPSIGNYEWTEVIGTDDNKVVIDEELNADYIDIKPRSITILVGKKNQSKPLEKKLKTEAVTKSKKTVNKKVSPNRAVKKGK
jgi:glycogen operon protein